jgi:hypothetical protein
MGANENNPRVRLRELYSSETGGIYRDFSDYAEWLETQLAVLKQSLSVHECTEPLYLKYEIKKRLRIYMDKVNGDGAWNPYVGSQLEEDLVNFIVTQSLCLPVFINHVP